MPADVDYGRRSLLDAARVQVSGAGLRKCSTQYQLLDRSTGQTAVSTKSVEAFSNFGLCVCSPRYLLVYK